MDTVGLLARANKFLSLNFFRIQQTAALQRRVIKNFSFLTILYFFGLVFPLLSYPYLIRVLGADVYGLIAFSQAVIGYLVVLTNFGFNLTAVKFVSVHRDDPEKLSEVVSAVLILKAGLSVLAFAVLAVVLPWLPQARGAHALFYLMMWMCLYEVIFPIWYFQGIEKMEYITYLTVSSRLLFLALIFIFIHGPGDYLMFPIVSALGGLAAGANALYIIFVRHGVRFRLQPVPVLMRYFSDAAPIFFSNVSSTLYVNTSKIIVGSFLGLTEVAYYDLAEKLTGILKTPIVLIGQSIFPKAAKEKNAAFMRQALRYTLLVSAAIVLLCIGIAGVIVSVIGGGAMMASVPVFRIYILTLLPITFSLFFADLILLGWGYNTEYFRLRLYSIVFYAAGIGLLYVLGQIGLVSLALVVLATEVYVACLSYLYCRKRSIFAGDAHG